MVAAINSPNAVDRVLSGDCFVVKAEMTIKKTTKKRTQNRQNDYPKFELAVDHDCA